MGFVRLNSILLCAVFLLCLIPISDLPASDSAVSEFGNRYAADNAQIVGYMRQIDLANNGGLDEGIKLIRSFKRESDLSLLNQLRLSFEEAFLLSETLGNDHALALLEGIKDVDVNKDDDPLVYAKIKQLEAFSIYLADSQKGIHHTSKIYSEVLPIFKAYGVVDEVIEIYISIAYDYELLDQIDKSIDVLLEGRAYALESEDNDGLATIDASLGYWAINNDEPNFERLNNLRKASDYFRQKNTQYEMLMANMIILFNRPTISDKEETKHYNESIELAKRLNSRSSLCSLMRMKSDYLAEKKNYDEAIRLAKETIDLANDLNARDLAYWISGDLVFYMVNSGDEKYYQEAYELIESILAISEDSEDPYRLISIGFDYATLLVRDQKNKEAVPYLDRVIRYYREQNYRGALIKALALKAENLFAMSQYEEAYRILENAYSEFWGLYENDYQEKLVRASYLLNNSIRENELKLTETENELAKLKIEEQALRIEHQKQQASQATYRQYALLTWFVIVLTLLVALSFFFFKTRRAEIKLRYLANELTHETQLLEEEQRMHVEANVELQASIIRHKETDEERKSILGIAAHDMKNPIAAIESTMSMIEMEVQDLNISKSNPIFGYLSLCQESTDYLNRMIQKILHARKAENRSAAMQLRWIDPNLIVKQTLSMNISRAQAKGMTFRYESDDRIEVYCDPQGLREALDNLISNAIKYSYLDSNIEICVRYHDELLHFKVKDGGPGFSDKDFKQLFKPFSKLSARPTGNENSNGLGLSLVKQVVESMQGDIRVENHPDGGAEFTLLFKGRIIEESVLV